MWAKWMGVALAAGVVCGYAGGASATTERFTFQASASGSPFGYFGYDTKSYSISVNSDGLVDEEVGAYLNNPNGLDTIIVFESAVGKGTVSTSVYTYGGSDFYAFNVSNIMFKDQVVTYDIVPGMQDPIITYGDIGYYKGNVSGTAGAEFDPSVISGIDIRGTLGEAETVASPFVTPDFVYQVYTVPLPPSAPLFGAAVLALGGLTYARRRLVEVNGT